MMSWLFMANKLENILSKIVKYGLYGILLTPLAFWPRALYGFMTPKFLLFQVLVEIVFGAWLILAITHKEYRPKFSWLLAAVMAFAGVSLISALLGVDFSRSVWGIGARMTGLFAEFHFLAWFLVFISVPKSNFDILKYLNFSFAICVILALSAFIQNPNWRIVYGYTIFSNPTFIAPYFLFHLFWGIYQSTGVRHPYFRLYFLGSSILVAMALILGQVRGAIIGLLAGILFVSIFLVFGDILRRRYKILITAFIALAILGVTTIFIFRNSEFVKSRSYLDRIGSISLNSITAQTRILTWQSAVKGFFDKPIFGVGPENFNYLFNAHYNPRLLMYGGNSFAETWQDKPHNAYLEILTETGIIGVLAYILIWLCVAHCLSKIFKRGEKFLAISLTAAFISYLLSIALSFDSFGSWFGLYLMLGFLASHNNTNTRMYANDANKSSKSISRIFVSFVCLFVLFALLYVNYGIWRANMADADALRVFPINPTAGMELFKKSLNYKSPYKSEYQFDLIASVGGAIEKNIPINNLEDAVNFILNETDKAIAAHHNNAGGYTDILRVYNILGTKGRDPEILAQAEAFGIKSLELSPNRQETLFYLARTALLQNNSTLAIKLTRQAVAVDSAINASHWYLGLALVASNQTNEGALEIKKALDLGYNPKNNTEKNFIKNLGL